MGHPAEKLFEDAMQLPASERRALALRVLASVPELTAPLIEKTPDVVGGSARITRTRIPVWTLESYRRQGLTDAQLLDSFPSLRAVDLVAAWAYADAHPDEIARDIHENDAA
jgi:uncharacterized protein (DUF433 family)